MLNATSTRDLNQSARAAANYLQELGIELPHAKALDLVARMVGKPNHMAAQADLPKPQSEPTKSARLAKLEPLLRGKPELVCVIEDLCRVLVHPDVEEALYKVGVSDAATNALGWAAVHVQDEHLLLDFPLDALTEAYDSLQAPVDEEGLMQGESHGMSSADFELAYRVGRALYAAKRNRAAAAEHPSEELAQRMTAQFELITGSSAKALRDSIRRFPLKSTEDFLQEVYYKHDVHLGVGPWLIANDDKKGFWCNGVGWTRSRMAATGLSETEKLSMQPDLVRMYGSYCRLVRFEEAFDYAEDEQDPTT
jgi:hypothetical protein